MSALQQLLAVTGIGLRSLGSRFATAMVIVVGMASVVGVLTSMLSLTSGLTRAFNNPRDAQRAIVWAGGANFDQSRSLHRDIVGTIQDAPGIARGTDGSPLADPEFLMRLPAGEGFADGSLALRGMGPSGVAMRPGLKVIAGQMFRPGRRELIVGKGASRNFGLRVGSTVQLVDGEWPVVGVFTDDGDILESYLVGDVDTIMDATRRHGYAQVLVQLTDPRDYPQFATWLTRNPNLGVSVERKVDYDRRQLGAQTDFFTHMAYLIGTIMALGAAFGVVKIMYAAVRSRTREIGTLRALGFGPTTIAASVLAESVLLGIIGALIGAGLAWMIFDGREMWVLGAFRLRVSADLLTLGLCWALLSSLLGGLAPALRAARIPAYEALRAA